jgi:hypothetical protein
MTFRSDVSEGLFWECHRYRERFVAARFLIRASMMLSEIGAGIRQRGVRSRVKVKHENTRTDRGP